MSNLKPYNVKIKIGKIEAEIFWQTTNCEHFLQNYQEEIELRKVSKNQRIHDLRFRDVANMLSKNVHLVHEPIKKTKRILISYYGNKYYQSIVSFQRRKKYKLLFAVIISCYICKNIFYINEYKETFQNEQNT